MHMTIISILAHLQSNSIKPEYKMTLPDVSLYFDVNNERKLPIITLEKIKIYLSSYEKRISMNVWNMYKEKYLFFLGVGNSQDISFIKSACRAEMKKSVTYYIDISISRSDYVCEVHIFTKRF